MAINDFVFLLFRLINDILDRVGYRGWFYRCCAYLWYYTSIHEPLLVLGFSVERLIAVVRPFQVCCRFIVLAGFVWLVSPIQCFCNKEHPFPNIWTIISKHQFKTVQVIHLGDLSTITVSLSFPLVASNCVLAF